MHQHRRHPPWLHESDYNLNLLRPLGIEPRRTAAPVAGEYSGTAQIESVLLYGGLAARSSSCCIRAMPGSAMNWSATRYADRCAGTPSVAFASSSPAVRRNAIWTGAGRARCRRSPAVDLWRSAHARRAGGGVRPLRAVHGQCHRPDTSRGCGGAPVIALYSLSAHRRRSAGVLWGPRVEVLQPNLDLRCPECLGPRCPYYQCMEQHLTVDAAVSTATRRAVALEMQSDFTLIFRYAFDMRHVCAFRRPTCAPSTQH